MTTSEYIDNRTIILTQYTIPYFEEGKFTQFEIDAQISNADMKVNAFPLKVLLDSEGVLSFHRLERFVAKGITLQFRGYPQDNGETIQVTMPSDIRIELKGSGGVLEFSDEPEVIGSTEDDWQELMIVVPEIMYQQKFLFERITIKSQARISSLFEINKVQVHY